MEATNEKVQKCSRNKITRRDLLGGRCEKRVLWTQKGKNPFYGKRVVIFTLTIGKK
jgi:hypothetical protein